MAAILGLSLCSWLCAEPVRFAVVGDTQGQTGIAVNEEGLALIVRHINDQQPPVRFVSFAGDLVSGLWNPFWQYDQYRIWKSFTQPLVDAGIAIYPAPGNHDQPNELVSGLIWRMAFPDLPDNGRGDDLGRTYSFDSGPCHLAIVNTSNPWRNHQVDLDWLEQDLAASDRLVKAVIGHNPAFPVGPHKGSSLDAYPELRNEFWQILTRNHVKVYFCGHEHVYDHWIKDNVHQVILGGAGNVQYAIVDADENDVRVSLFDPHTSTPVDSFLLSETENVAHEDRPAESAVPPPEFPCSVPFFAVFIGLAGLTAVTSDTPWGRHDDGVAPAPLSSRWAA
jgi:3',5'-cyclic AMP phosphodiesterase CpdA